MYRADLACLQLQASSTDFLHWLEHRQFDLQELQAQGLFSNSDVVEAFRRLHDDDTAPARSNDGTVPTDITAAVEHLS